MLVLFLRRSYCGADPVSELSELDPHALHSSDERFPPPHHKAVIVEWMLETGGGGRGELIFAERLLTLLAWTEIKLGRHLHNQSRGRHSQRAANRDQGYGHCDHSVAEMLSWFRTLLLLYCTHSSVNQEQQLRTREVMNVLSSNKWCGNSQSSVWLQTTLVVGPNIVGCHLSQVCGATVCYIYSCKQHADTLRTAGNSTERRMREGEGIYVQARWKKYVMWMFCVCYQKAMPWGVL